MRFLVAIWIVSTLLSASTDVLKHIQELYKSGEYQSACQYGYKYFSQFKKNTQFLMIYAFACLNADYIDRVAVPMIALRYTAAERLNATYLATVLLQKKMLYNALMDGIDIQQVRLPLTPHILSRVFWLYTQGRYRKDGSTYIMHDPRDKARIYHLYLKKNGTHSEMVIDEYRLDHFVKTHRYW